LGAAAAAVEVSAVKGLRRGWLVLSSVVLLAPESYAQLTTSFPAVIAEPEASPEASNVKTFELRQSFLIVVDGRIGPLEHLKFILDTGASHTVVSRKIADQLAVSREAGSVINFQRKLPVEWARFPEVQVGPIVATDAWMMVADLNQYSEFTKDIDAIAGLDLLSRCQRVQIDYEAKLIAFHARSDASQAPLFQAKGIFVTLMLQDQPVHLLVDTGFQEIALFEERLRPLMQRVRVQQLAQAQIGSLVGDAVRLSGLRLGSDRSNPPVLLIRGKTEAVPGGLDGYLGPRALGAKKIELDFAAMMLRWQ
jgi:predicted aspartyl protease